MRPSRKRGASKAGVEAMANSLRTEVAEHGVEVATIHPTWIDNDMVREGEGSMRASQVLRAALRPLRAAPEMQRVYREELAARGERAAAVSERIGLQLERAGERAA